jgi:UDP-N-acetyl-D-galactosamine dehydrogenase
MGLAFKENCPDIRNTRVVDLVEEFKCSNCIIDVYDPWVNQDQAMDEYNIKLIEQPLKGKYDAIVLAVAHDIIKELSLEQIKAFGKDNHVLYDIKYLLGPNEVDGRL